MSVSFWFARRYLFSKKSKNAINYITTVSVILIAIVSLALTITMSVFNGLSDIITSMFNQFDPDIKITATSGRVFSLDSVEHKIKSHDEIYAYTPVLDDDALVRFWRNLAMVGCVATDVDGRLAAGRAAGQEFVASDYQVVAHGAFRPFDFGTDPQPRADGPLHDVAFDYPI